MSTGDYKGVYIVLHMRARYRDIPLSRFFFSGATSVADISLADYGR